MPRPVTVEEANATPADEVRYYTDPLRSAEEHAPGDSWLPVASLPVVLAEGKRVLLFLGLPGHAGGLRGWRFRAAELE